jgi:hypothetical protein
LKERRVSTGKDMLSYILFHLSSIKRSQGMEPWLRSWLRQEAKVLTPEDWFERGHHILRGKADSKGFWRHNAKPRTFIWDPPPAAASVVLEKVRKARIKRQDSPHVFVVLPLLKPEWFCLIYKIADIVFEVLVGSECWPTNMYEPLR